MTISVVQTASNQGSNSNTLTVTLTNPTAAHNCLVVTAESSDFTINPSVTGIKLGGLAGNFAALVPPIGTAATTAGIVDIWADPDCAGGQTVITITWSSGGAHEQFAVVYEVSGLVLTSLLDKSSTAFTTATNPTWSSGTTATTTQANEIWFGANGAFQTTITGPGAPWTNTIITGPSRDFISGFQIVSSTGTAVYSGSYSPNSFSEAGVVTLKGAGGTPVNVNGLVAQVNESSIFGSLKVAPSVNRVQVNSISNFGSLRTSFSGSTVRVNPSAILGTPNILLPPVAQVIARAPQGTVVITGQAPPIFKWITKLEHFSKTSIVTPR